MSHSPEPWSIGEQTCMGGGYNYFHFIDKNGLSIARKGFSDKDISMRDEDAERIIECVNACAGIKNPKEIIMIAKNMFQDPDL